MKLGLQKNNECMYVRGGGRLIDSKPKIYISSFFLSPLFLEIALSLKVSSLRVVVSPLLSEDVYFITSRRGRRGE
jgi:hypothetical protein